MLGGVRGCWEMLRCWEMSLVQARTCYATFQRAEVKFDMSVISFLFRLLIWAHLNTTPASGHVQGAGR